MNNSRNYLPLSAERYFLTEDAVVYDSSAEKEIPRMSEDGHIVVELDWILGRKKYPVALLMLATFRTIGIEHSKYHEIEPLYEDGDNQNLEIKNLLYRFRNGPIETKHYSEYFHVPFFPLYAISRSGDLINIETGKLKAWNIMHPVEQNGKVAGYRYSRVIRDDGVSTTAFRHRMLALTFIPYPHNVKRLEVNHGDGIKGNDFVDNLEWSTHKGNVDHAFDVGLNNINKPVLVYNFITKEEKYVRSVGAAARYVSENSPGKEVDSRGLILHRLRQTADFVLYVDGWLFKYADDKRPWPVVPKDAKLRRVNKLNKVFAKNVFTGDVTVFRDSRHASELLEIAAETIKEHARNLSAIPYQGYMFRYPVGGGMPEWPEFSKYQLEIFRKHPVYPPTGLLSRCVRTGEERLFTSVKEAMAFFKVTQTTIWSHVNSKRPFQGTYLLEYVRTNGKVAPKK